MNGANWLQIVYLLAVLGLMVGTVRTHQLGGRRMLVMALAWLCIFMIAAGIAAYIDGRAHGAPPSPRSPNTDASFT